MTLEEILAEHYYDYEVPLNLLSQYKLEEVLKNSIELARKELEGTSVDFHRFGTIAASLLISVNAILKGISNPVEKCYLEVVISEIANHLLIKIMARSKSPERLISQVKFALESTSKINGYDFNALATLLKLNQEKLILRNNSMANEKSIFYYRWNGRPAELNEMITSLKSNSWILSSRDFHKLFTNHNDFELRVKCSSEKAVDLLALFDVLKDAHLIAPKGGKGHFHPLKLYLVDLENNFLYKYHPKTIKNRAKRKKAEWDTKVKNAQKLISGFKVDVTLKVP